MERLSRHAALIISISSIITGIISWAMMNTSFDYHVIVGFFLIGALFFLIWLGQRGDK